MPQTLDQCKAAHPATPLHTVSFDGVEFVYRKPTRAEWSAYKTAANTAQHFTKDSAGLFEAMEDVAKDCCVSHNPMELEACADENYDLFEQLFDVISDLVVKKAAAEGK